MAYPPPGPGAAPGGYGTAPHEAMYGPPPGQHGGYGGGGYAPPPGPGGYAPPGPGGYGAPPPPGPGYAPQGAYAPQGYQQQTTVVVGGGGGGDRIMVVQDKTVDHGAHCCLWFFTAGLWLPFWVMACFGCGCERPCN
uniref:Uncharacterized protein n=1 Tax=Bicosoecida sp. CB-2014 TaxID=1486930 RepID=A0A7S1C5J4_9STRA|mmetsp:Transcript_14519/g.50559  ORF Transcript_14519/g.50559 Transcript_14519/m.50559 type:complete len:137 (+) Transcript_14519:73-483(+)